MPYTAQWCVSESRPCPCRTSIPVAKFTGRDILSQAMNVRMKIARGVTGAFESLTLYPAANPIRRRIA